MKTIGISTIEASIYVEYIQNYISDTFSKFQEKCALEIQRTSSDINFNALSPKALKQMVNIKIVQPYTTLIEELTKDIDNSLYEYFEIIQGQFSIQPVDDHIYDYHINNKLIKEYENTEKISVLIEKLINKTLDFTCLDQMQTPLIKKFVDPISVGSLFMSSLGLDSSILRSGYKEGLCKTLKGISKNINIRAKNSLLKQYTALIYQIIDDNQVIYTNEQAV